MDDRRALAEEIGRPLQEANRAQGHEVRRALAQFGPLRSHEIVPTFAAIASAPVLGGGSRLPHPGVAPGIQRPESAGANCTMEFWHRADWAMSLKPSTAGAPRQW